MRYFKVIKSGSVQTIGTGAEYEELCVVFLNRSDDAPSIDQLRAEPNPYQGNMALAAELFGLYLEAME